LWELLPTIVKGDSVAEAKHQAKAAAVANIEGPKFCLEGAHYKEAKSYWYWNGQQQSMVDFLLKNRCKGHY
jgi:hypothetical protein